MSAISLNIFFLNAKYKLRICVSDLWKERLQRYRDIFLERESYISDECKRTGASMNISELLGFEVSLSGNLTSINVLTVQQISPHHKLCVYHIVQVCAQELGSQSA